MSPFALIALTSGVVVQRVYARELLVWCGSVAWGARPSFFVRRGGSSFSNGTARVAAYPWLVSPAALPGGVASSPMASVLLLHSALGLRPAVHALVDHLHGAGHEIIAPDLLEGRTFAGGDAGYAEAVAHMRQHKAAIEERAGTAYASMSGPRVVLGFSMGAGIAQEFAQTRPEVVGAILCGGGGFFDGWTPDSWRPDVPLALHHAVEDPWADPVEARLLVDIAARAGADVSHYVYPGNGHLFFDPGLPEEYDSVLADLLATRLLGFLSRFA